MTGRILVVDDHIVVREGVQALIDKQPDMMVIGQAADGETAVKLALALVPDVVVADVSMPELNGIEMTRQIMNERDDIAVLCLSLHAEQHVVSSMLRAGASGYVLKSSAAEELIEAIRVVSVGQIYLSPAIATGVIRDYRTFLAADDEAAGAHLTERERDVLRLIAEGHETKAIAEKLFISPKTVATHRSHIMEKVGLHGVSALTKYAIRRGITTIESDLV